MRLRVPLRIPAPVRVAQGIAVVAGGFEPLGRFLHGLYALGLRMVVARLVRHEAVHSIYGCGSFFEGGCLYGHSDIDLIIVLKASVTRAAGAHAEIARSYENVRRCFPFLGRWDEKAASLVFLEEAETGFPVLESFRVRMKLGRLVRLYGEPFPVDLGSAPLTMGEVAAERGAILRTAILNSGPQPWTAIFWKRLFDKMQALAENAQLPAVAAGFARESRRRFGTLPDRRLFFRRVHPGACCAALFRLTAEMAPAESRHQPSVTLRFASSTAKPDAPDDPALLERIRVLLRDAGLGNRDVRLLHSVPIGLTPQLFYFPPDTAIPFVELPGDSYESLRHLLAAMRRRTAAGDAVLVRAQGMLFVVARGSTYSDLVPLDAQVHANLYAWVDGRAECTMPRALYDEQRAEAAQRFTALAAMYRRHEDWVPKAWSPGVYREDDLDTLNNTFGILRSLAATSETPTYLMGAADLAAYFARRHPETAVFLAGLLADYRYHRGEIAERPAAPNLFRCLHQFVFQVLTGATPLVLADHEQGLGITVGIITRNRAPDLREALQSLEGLRRRPDEVVVVDNGSTDDTRAVILSFADRLPIRYVLVAEPSIPRARNAVIEHARHEVIAFTDDDCAVGREWLTAVERGFMRARNVGIVGGWVLHWPAPEPSTVDTYFGVFHHNKP